MFEDKTLTCRECGQQFVFTASEQQFYAEKGFQNAKSSCLRSRLAWKRFSENSLRTPLGRFIVRSFLSAA